jgi:hypothetical protein
MDNAIFKVKVVSNRNEPMENLQIQLGLDTPRVCTGIEYTDFEGIATFSKFEDQICRIYINNMPTINSYYCADETVIIKINAMDLLYNMAENDFGDISVFEELVRKHGELETYEDTKYNR